MPRLVIAFLVVSVVWGSTFLGVRIALESVPPFFLGALRFICAGAALFVYAWARGEAPPTRLEWRSALLTGVLFFVVGNGLINVAEQSISSGLASCLVATMPLWATLLSPLFGERVSFREAAGLALGLVGVTVMNAGGELSGSPMGTMCGLLAPMGWALGSLYSRRLMLPSGLMRTAAQMLAGGTAMLVLSAALGELSSIRFTPRTTAAAVYLALVGSLVAFSAFQYLLRHARASVATSYAYVNPVIALALGVFFGGEKLDMPSVVGAAIVLGGVALVIRSRTAETVRPLAAPPMNRIVERT